MFRLSMAGHRESATGRELRDASSGVIVSGDTDAHFIGNLDTAQGAFRA